MVLDQNSSIVMCPGCDEPMKPVEQKPILSTDGLVDVTYFCETCHTKTVRTIKPSGGGASRLGLTMPPILLARATDVIE